MVGKCMPNSGPGDALGPELWQFVCPMLRPNVQILFDEIFLTWPYGHLRAWFLVFYYWINYEKSNDGYTSSGGWSFCKFVDFQLFILMHPWWLELGKLYFDGDGVVWPAGKRISNAPQTQLKRSSDAPQTHQTHLKNNWKSTNLQKVHPPKLVYPDSDFS